MVVNAQPTNQLDTQPASRFVQAHQPTCSSNQDCGLLGWLVCLVCVWLHGWSAGWGWLVGWLVALLVSWLGSVGLFAGWLVGWSFRWLAGRLL